MEVITNDSAKSTDIQYENSNPIKVSPKIPVFVKLIIGVFLVIPLFCLGISFGAIFYSKDIAQYIEDKRVEKIRYEGYDRLLLDEAKSHFSITLFEDNAIEDEYLNFLYVGFESNRNALLKEFNLSTEDLNRVDVILYTDAVDFSKIRDIKDDGIILQGFAINERTIYFFINIAKKENIRYFDIEYGATHEFTHLIQYKLFGRQALDLPYWYIEGMAEYEAQKYCKCKYSNYVDYGFVLTTEELVNSEYWNKIISIDLLDSLIYSDNYEISKFAYSASYHFFNYIVDNLGLNNIIEIGKRACSENKYFEMVFWKIRDEYISEYYSTWYAKTQSQFNK